MAHTIHALAIGGGGGGAKRSRRRKGELTQNLDPHLTSWAKCLRRQSCANFLIWLVKSSSTSFESIQHISASPATRSSPPDSSPSGVPSKERRRLQAPCDRSVAQAHNLALNTLLLYVLKSTGGSQSIPISVQKSFATWGRLRLWLSTVPVEQRAVIELLRAGKTFRSWWETGQNKSNSTTSHSYTQYFLAKVCCGQVAIEEDEEHFSHSPNRPVHSICFQANHEHVDEDYAADHFLLDKVNTLFDGTFSDQFPSSSNKQGTKVRAEGWTSSLCKFQVSNM